MTATEPDGELGRNHSRRRGDAEFGERRPHRRGVAHLGTEHRRRIELECLGRRPGEDVEVVVVEDDGFGGQLAQQLHDARDVGTFENRVGESGVYVGQIRESGVVAGDFGGLPT